MLIQFFQIAFHSPFHQINPNGKISGRHLDDFLANPTLRETANVRSNCLFNSVEVVGSVFVKNTLNDINLDHLLDDVIYKHASNQTCTSFKTFTSIAAPNIVMKSKLLNGISLDAFMTNDTEQTFSVDKIHGNVFFNRLNVDGLVDSINVTDLDLNAIKRFGEQFTDAELIFEENGLLEINASRLVVRETINDINVNDFIDIDGKVELFGDIVLDSFTTNECTVGGEIVGDNANASINGFNVEKLKESHLSQKNEQQIPEAIFIEKAIIRNGFNTKQLNGFDFNQAIEILKHLKSVSQMLNDSLVLVNKMIVNGNIKFNDVNGLDFNRFRSNAIRLDEPNSIKMPIEFLDSIVINGNLTLDRLNGVNFNEFVDDLVKRSEENIVILGSTVFHENVDIGTDIETANVNGFSVDQILTKDIKNGIANPIEIIGDVTISQLTINGHFNGINFKDRIGAFEFDEHSQTYVFHKNVVFNQNILVDNLELNGGINNIKNARDHVKSIVRIDQPVVVRGSKTFSKKIHVEGDIDILQYNNIDVHNLLSNIILIDQSEPVIMDSNVEFKDAVTMPSLEVNADLYVTSANNCSIENWSKNTIRTDSPFEYNGAVVFAEGTIDAGNIIAETLNGLPINRILTLNTPQIFNESVIFDVVDSFIPITTDGLVNGFNLQSERENTLMVRYSIIQFFFISFLFSKQFVSRIFFLLHHNFLGFW